MNLKNHIVQFFVLVVMPFLLYSGPVYSQDKAFDRESVKVRDSIVLRSKAKLYGTVDSEGIEDGRK